MTRRNIVYRYRPLAEWPRWFQPTASTMRGKGSTPLAISREFQRRQDAREHSRLLKEADKARKARIERLWNNRSLTTASVAAQLGITIEELVIDIRALRHENVELIDRRKLRCGPDYAAEVVPPPDPTALPYEEDLAQKARERGHDVTVHPYRVGRETVYTWYVAGEGRVDHRRILELAGKALMGVGL